MEITVSPGNPGVEIYATSDEVLALINDLSKVLLELAKSSLDDGSIEISDESGEIPLVIHVEKTYNL